VAYTLRWHTLLTKKTNKKKYKEKFVILQPIEMKSKEIWEVTYTCRYSGGHIHVRIKYPIEYLQVHK